MKVSEIIELTQTKTIAEIAKESLQIGEKPARKAMKLAGCYTIVGMPGWHFEEGNDPENLNKSIYDFSDQIKKRRKMEMKMMAELSLNDWDDDLMVPRKRHSFDLDVRLVKELKVFCVKNDMTLYEVVEQSIKDYLEREDNKESTAL